MTFSIERVLIDGAAGDEFGFRVEDNGAVHYGFARFAKPEGADASMFGVTCYVRAVEQEGIAVIRMSGRALMVSHAASEPKASHRIYPEAVTLKLMRQALDGAIASMLEEIAVESGNRTMLAGVQL